MSALAKGLYGHWDLIPVMLKAVGKAYEASLADGADKIGKGYVNAVKKHISKQDLDLAPLAESTVAQKTAHETEWWIETGLFYKKLAYIVDIKQRSFSIKSGALDSVIYKGDLTMEQIAKILELGDDKIIGRPLFRLSAEMYEEIAKSIIQKGIDLAIKKHWI